MLSRAHNAEDKEQRRESLLDAAEQLWLQQPGRVGNVAEIAALAGVAKGTVYLYFRSKEELLLALHGRHVGIFFDRVISRAGQPKPMQNGDMMLITAGFLQDFPAFLPLASLCHGLLERQIPLEVGLAFETRTHEHLQATVEALRMHFPHVSQALMLQSYALILGLWQLLRPTPLKTLLRQHEVNCPCTDDYLQMLEGALLNLWKGTLGES